MDKRKLTEELDAARKVLGQRLTDLECELNARDGPQGDLGDRGQDAGSTQDVFIQASILQYRILEIEKTLRLIRDGGFGYCRRCGSEIHPERLQANPHARLCTDCVTRIGRVRRGY